MFPILLLIATVFSTPVHADLLVVWNVGQGQWVTTVRKNSCSHFDVGGEFKPGAAKLKLYCAGKENHIYFSHWDWDHTGFTKYILSLFPRVCVARKPGGEGSEAKLRMLASLKPCPPEKPLKTAVQTLMAIDGKTANAHSNIFVSHGSTLIPGDSPTSQEKLWLHRLQGAWKIRTLILGHHGSRTSTSLDLLQHLPHLNLAIASARSPRYGHPHLQTILRLQKAGIPMLRTEDWGHILRPLPTQEN